MKLQLLRHATIIVTMGDMKILVDPMLKPAESSNPIPTHKKGKGFKNPLVDLPISHEDLIEMLGSIDAILITHMHFDHFDDDLIQNIPKEMPILCQHEDEMRLKEIGFKMIYPISKETTWKGIKIDRIKCHHGGFLLRRIMGTVSGFVLRYPEEPSIYIAGDTVWCPNVENTLEQFKPEVTVINSGAAQLPFGRSITMDCKDISKVCKADLNTKIVAIHMEAINHCLLTRKELNEFLIKNEILSRVIIPEDGDVLEFKTILKAK